MKSWVNTSVLVLLAAVVIGLTSQAQYNESTVAAAPPDSIVQLAAEDQGLEAVAPENLPRSGTFWVVSSNGLTAPYPCYPGEAVLPVFSIVNGIYLVDASGGMVSPNVRRSLYQTAEAPAVSPLEALANTVLNLIGEIQSATEIRELRQLYSALGLDGPPGFDDTGEGGDYTNQFTSTFCIDTNLLWLELTNVSQGTVHALLHSGTNQFTTNQVFAIWTTTNLLTPWQVELEVWPTSDQTNLVPFTLPMLNREMLFVRSEDWTDKDSNADGVPDWWLWKYFHTLDLTYTNLDSTGLHTLLEDFTNGVDPNLIAFTVGAANDYVNTTTADVQADITAGQPAYYAVLVNSASTTNWLTFTGTNLPVNLGSTDGVYNVSVGLKGYPDDATQAWRHYRFHLDRVAPQLSITNPILVNGSATVIKPYLQLKGLADEPLASLRYDLSNAMESVSNEMAVVDGQYLDPVKNTFTTNYFHANDVALATNENVITLRVTDWAGNTTATNFTVILDYATATNPPAVKLVWPQDGMAVSGTNLTIRGMTSDETGTIAATVVNGDGTTNVIAGLIERNGMFWIEHVPLNGTNQISLQANNAAGTHGMTTNFTVNPSDLILTIDSTPTGNALYEPAGSVSGTVSSPDLAVWVNGVEADSYWSDGTVTHWTVEKAPIHGRGTATFDAVAGPVESMEMSAPAMRTMAGSTASIPGGSPVASASTSVEKGFMVKVTRYTDTQTDKYIYNGNLREEWRWTKNYTADYQQGDDQPIQCTHTAYEYVFSEDYYRYEIWYDLVTGLCDWKDWTGNLYTNLAYGAQENWKSGKLAEVPDVNYAGTIIYGTPGSADFYIQQYLADQVKYTWQNEYGYGSASSEEVTADAHTEVKLFTGGKGLLKRKNLFCLEAGADEYYDRAQTAPWIHTPGKGITDKTTLVIGSLGRPGSDGKLWIALDDNDDPLATVKAPATQHSGDSPAQKHKLVITANGNNLSQEIGPISSAPEFCVGQKVDMQAAWDPPLPSGTQASYSWVFSPDFIDKIVPPAANTTSTSYLLDLTLLTNNPVPVWWHSGGYKFNWCLTTNIFSNGQKLTLQGHGDVAIYRPQFVGIANEMPNQILVRTNTSVLGLGNGTGATNDLSLHFNVQTKSKRRGNIDLTQLIKTDRYYDTTPVTAKCYDSDGAFYLDNGLHNGGSMGFGLNLGSNIVQNVAYFDAPSLAGFYSKVDIKDSFKVYVQFTLNEGGTGDNIPVTLAILSWNWEAHSQNPYHAGSWQLTGTNYISDVTATVDDSFPVWYDEVNNDGDYDLCW